MLECEFSREGISVIPLPHASRVRIAGPDLFVGVEATLIAHLAADLWVMQDALYPKVTITNRMGKVLLRMTETRTIYVADYVWLVGAALHAESTLIASFSPRYKCWRGAESNGYHKALDLEPV